MGSNNSGEGPSWLNKSTPCASRCDEVAVDNYVDIEVEGEPETEVVDSGDIQVEDGFDFDDIQYEDAFDFGDLEDDDCYEDDHEDCGENGCEDGFEVDMDIEKSYIIGSLHEVVSLDLKNLNPCDVRNMLFESLEMAFTFYYWFARANGFSARKCNVLKNRNGEILQQTFVCYRQGFKKDNGLTVEDRKRCRKPETRCGCAAKIRVHVDINTRLWYITYFLDDHNHELLKEMHCRMLPSHRVLTDLDVMQLNNMRAVGISTPHIYGSIAYQCGGYDRVGFRNKDLYNQVGRQRKMKNMDAKSALQYLSGLGENDPAMFFRHTVDGENRLKHLFWCDGTMQMDYNLFGDVLAFDATYGKNKYECPLVVFSGVNHHDMTVVFAAAIVANEKEETYVWVLEQFLEAMKGKFPVSVITDGDLAIKNSIKRVFPNAHHRLCAWHLLRNATSNVNIAAFKHELRKCMLGDYEVGEFKRKWSEMVSKFNLERHPWVVDLYEKRKMWCTAYMRGNFFAGFRTTSRCEALHSQIAKFVYSRYNLTELLQHFHRCLNFMRHREVEADFDSIHGNPMVRTQYNNLERSAANVFTRKILNLFVPVLDRSGTISVVGCKECYDYLIYIVSKYEFTRRVWHVSFKPSSNEFKCSCRRMESVGLPCDHILRLLVYLNISELPNCLILKRWTKWAKEDVRAQSSLNNFWGSEKDARYFSLMEYFKDVSVLAAESFEDYNDQRQRAINECQYLMDKKAAGSEIVEMQTETNSMHLRDPSVVRPKGGRGHNRSASSSGRQSRIKKCSVCKQQGHNKRSCSMVVNVGQFGKTPSHNCYEDEEQYEDDVIYSNADFSNGDEYYEDESAVHYECQSFEGSTYDSIDEDYIPM